MLEAHRENALPSIHHVGKYHISVFELNQLSLEYENTEQQFSDVINLLEETVGDHINLFNGSLELVNILYNVLFPEYEAIQPFAPERELILAIGGAEILISSDPNQTIPFTYLDHLAAIESEDLIAIQLYQNSDTANILWQQALEGLAITSSDNLGSAQVNSFIITPEAEIRSTDGERLKYPQEAFTVQLLNPIGEGDSYQWEIEVSDQDKYGTIQFEGLILPPGNATTETVSGKTKYTWRSNITSDPQFRIIKFRPNETSPRHLPETYCGVAKNIINPDNTVCESNDGGTDQIDIQQKNPQYTYNIKVAVNSRTLGPLEYRGKIQMDHKDMVRQEYINHIVSSSEPIDHFDDIIRVPMRDDLISKDSLQGVLAGEWSSAPYKFMYERHMSLLSNLVLNGFTSQQAQTYSVPGGGTETLPGGADQIDSLRLNSGWRNPERQESFGSVITSRHMVGRANDIGSEGVLLADTISRAKLMWTLWNTADDLPASNVDGVRFRWLLEDADATSDAAKPNYSPYGVRLVEAGTTTSDAVPNTVSSDDERGAKSTDDPDGIPDYFNYASHLHAETKPTRKCGNGQVEWGCE